MKKIYELPGNIQLKIRNTLKAYDRVDVYYENGMYRFGLCIKKTYAPDHEVIGTYYAKDIFTEEERIINYVEAFHDYPIQYKGKRDYAWLKTLTSWDDKVKFDENGNLVNA